MPRKKNWKKQHTMQSASHGGVTCPTQSAPTDTAPMEMASSDHTAPLTPTAALAFTEGTEQPAQELAGDEQTMAVTQATKEQARKAHRNHSTNTRKRRTKAKLANQAIQDRIQAELATCADAAVAMEVATDQLISTGVGRIGQVSSSSAVPGDSNVHATSLNTLESNSVPTHTAVNELKHKEVSTGRRAHRRRGKKRHKGKRERGLLDQYAIVHEDGESASERGVIREEVEAHPDADADADADANLPLVEIMDEQEG